MGGKVFQQIIKIFLVIAMVLLSLPSFAQDAQKSISGLNVEDFNKAKDANIVWSKNPFLKPANEVAFDELALTGIIYSADEAAALINDMVVKKGDKVGSSEIVEIEKERVILRNENGIFSLGFTEKN